MITYDQLMQTKDPIPAYNWKILLEFYNITYDIRRLGKRKLKFLKNLGYIELKDNKYVLTTFGNMLLMNRLGVNYHAPTTK